jgi:hypothetical protein
VRLPAVASHHPTVNMTQPTIYQLRKHAQEVIRTQSKRKLLTSGPALTVVWMLMSLENSLTTTPTQTSHTTHRNQQVDDGTKSDSSSSTTQLLHNVTFCNIRLLVSVTIGAVITNAHTNFHSLTNSTMTIRAICHHHPAQKRKRSNSLQPRVQLLLFTEPACQHERGYY